MKDEMITTDYCGEFGFELQLVVPYAYWCHKHGKLEKTISSKKSGCLYYFSPSHEQKYQKRQYMKVTDGLNETPHVKELNYAQWIPPPYKEIYGKHPLIRMRQPLCIIHNKFTQEWGSQPINFISLETLNNLIVMLKPKYKIIYVNPRNSYITNDEQRKFFLDDRTVLRNHSEVINANKLYSVEFSRKMDFNEFQFRLHAQCSHFISTQGGNSVIASYFGGKNIILAKKGQELKCDSYEGHYRKYSNCDIHVVKTDDLLLKKVKELYV